MNSIQRRFTNPETFRKIRPELLWAWLKGSESYLIKHGVVLPATPENLGWGPLCERLDYEGIVRVFIEPTADMPAHLVDGLHLIHETGRQQHVDKMLEAAAKHGLRLGERPDDTPVDIALRVLMANARVLEDMVNCRELSRARTYVYYSTDANPLPCFEGPTREQMGLLEAQVGEFYEALHGAKGTRVFEYMQERGSHEPPEWLFLVRYGVRPKREEAMENGEPTCVVFRPRKTTVLKYDPARGEMGVWCATERERRVLLKHFGKCLFGRADYFPVGTQFDLGPLGKLGRAALACRDIMGIEQVRLTELEFHQKEEPWNRIVRQADDVFSLLERDDVEWPKNPNHVTKATFTIQLCNQKKLRRISIIPSNRAIYTRDEHTWICIKFLEKRGFIKGANVGGQHWDLVKAE